MMSETVGRQQKSCKHHMAATVTALVIVITVAVAVVTIIIIITTIITITTIIITTITVAPRDTTEVAILDSNI